MGSHRNLGGVLVEYRPEVLTVRTEYMEVDTKKKTGKKNGRSILSQYGPEYYRLSNKRLQD